MKYEAIFFDWDGVITDSVNIKTKAFAELYGEHGEDVVQRVIEYHLAHGGMSRYKKIRYFHNELLRFDVTDNEVNALAEKFSAIVFQKVVESDFIPGVVETINRD